MSATKAGSGTRLARFSPTPARPTIGAARASRCSRALRLGAAGRRRAGLTESPTRNQPPCPNPTQTDAPETWWESFQRAERARAGRLRVAVADDAWAARRGDAPRRSDLRAARRMERAPPRAGPDGPRRVRMDRREAPGGVRMTAPGTSRRADGVVYLVHFTEPYRHARHYTGWTADLDSRLAEHQAGRGARLLQVITQAGIDWTLARTWQGTRAARAPAQAPGRRVTPMPDLPRRTRAQHDERVPRHRHRPAAAGARRTRRRQLPKPAAAARARARSSPRAGRTRAAPGRAWAVAPGSPRRHANRPNRAGAMTATAPSRATGAQALDSYLRVLAGPAPGARLLEIRFALRHRDMGRLFIAAHSAPGAARLIRRLASRTDVYVGVCLRSRRAGGRDAIDRSHLAFVEIDAPDALDRLRAFPHPPTMIVSSGSAGHAHAYFALSAPVTVPELERANRRLAHRSRRRSRLRRCRADPRPPPSWNHKHSPPAPVELVELDPARRYDLDELVDGLDDPPGRTVRAAARRSPYPAHRARPAASRDPGRRIRARARRRLARSAGKIHCPFHDLSVGEATAGAVMPARSHADASSRDRASADPLLLVPPPVYFERLTGCGSDGRASCAACSMTIGTPACTCIRRRAAVGIASGADAAARCMTSRRCSGTARRAAGTSWSCGVSSRCCCCRSR